MSIASDLGLAAGECMDWVHHFWNVSVGSGNGAKNLLGVAQQQGWQISTTPVVGSIAVFQPGTYSISNGKPFYVGSDGHAAIVTAASGDGSAYTMSEMNGIAGYGNVDQQTMITSGAVAFVTPPANLKQGNNFENTFGANSQTLNNVPGTTLGGNAAPLTATGCQSLGQIYATQGGIPVISGVSGFFTWIGQGCVWKRILLYMACGGLIVFGLRYVGVPEPARIAEAPLRVVKPATEAAAAA